jgi:hypothetical protein
MACLHSPPQVQGSREHCTALEDVYVYAVLLVGVSAVQGMVSTNGSPIILRPNVVVVSKVELLLVDLTTCSIQHIPAAAVPLGSAGAWVMHDPST